MLLFVPVVETAGVAGNPSILDPASSQLDRSLWSVVGSASLAIIASKIKAGCSTCN